LCCDGKSEEEMKVGSSPPLQSIGGGLDRDYELMLSFMYMKDLK
jgi:hypothetical protein